MSPDIRRIPVRDLALQLTRSSRSLHPHVPRIDVSVFVHTVTDAVADLRAKYVVEEPLPEASPRALTVPEALEVLERMRTGAEEAQFFADHHHLDPAFRRLRRLDRAGEVFDAARQYVHRRKKRLF